MRMTNCHIRSKGSLTVATVGYSTHPIEDFIRSLQAHGITRIVDVRAIPHSRHNPQYNQDCLVRTLKQAGISYAHLPDLGGLRHALSASRNLGWRNEAFRGFADYMATPAFEEGVRKLLRFARKGKIALMCVEAVPWACHRCLIADALLVRGIRVNHILSAWGYEPHQLTSFAKVRELHLSYPKVKRPRQTPRHTREARREEVRLSEFGRRTGSRLRPQGKRAPAES